MAYGVQRVFNVVIASGATLSSEIDLGQSFRRVYIDPTGAASEVRFQAAGTSGGTYRQVLQPSNPNTTTIETNIWKVASAASGSLQAAPDGFRFMKVETTAAVANGVTLKLHCGE